MIVNSIIVLLFLLFPLFFPPPPSPLLPHSSLPLSLLPLSLLPLSLPPLSPLPLSCSPSQDVLQGMKTKLTAKIDLVNSQLECPLNPRNEMGQLLDCRKASMQELFKVVSVGGGVGGEECGERCVRGRCVGGMWGEMCEGEVCGRRECREVVRRCAVHEIISLPPFLTPSLFLLPPSSTKNAQLKSLNTSPKRGYYSACPPKPSPLTTTTSV